GGVIMRSVIILLLFCAGAGVAQAQQVIPFDLQDNLVHVQAVINGKKASAVLDSGTGGLLVSKHFAKALGLKLEHSGVQASAGGKGQISLSSLKLKTVQFGPIVLNGASAYATDIHYLSKSSGFTIDALLGYPIF